MNLANNTPPPETWRGKDAKALTLEETCQGIAYLRGNLKIGHAVRCAEFFDVVEAALCYLEKLQDLESLHR